MQYYNVTFYKWREAKDKEPELEQLGRVRVSDFKTSLEDSASLIGKAFKHASSECLKADHVKVERHYIKRMRSV
jgi:hypothetical protein